MNVKQNEKAHSNVYEDVECQSEEFVKDVTIMMDGMKNHYCIEKYLRNISKLLSYCLPPSKKDYI